MKKILIVALALVASASFNTAAAGGKKDKKKDAATTTVQRQALTSGKDSLSYAGGMTMTQGLEPYLQQQFGVTASQMPDVVRGFEDAVRQRNDSAFIAYMAGQQIMNMVKTRMVPGMAEELGDVNEDAIFSGFADALKKDYSMLTDSAAQVIFTAGREAVVKKRTEANRIAGETFLAENAKKEGVKTTASGLQYKVLKEGNGPTPKETDKVKVIYEGRTLDGNVFDATSKHRGVEYDSFGVNGLIKGWTEALLLMPVGSKWELYIPQELAYGERGAGGHIPPYSALIFTLELVGIE